MMASVHLSSRYVLSHVIAMCTSQITHLRRKDAAHYIVQCQFWRFRILLATVRQTDDSECLQPTCLPHEVTAAVEEAFGET